METILALQIPLIQALQSASGPDLVNFYHSLSFLSEEWFLLLFIPFIVWSVNYRTGVRLMLLLLVGVIINWLVKDMGGQPRPFVFDQGVKALAEVEGYGLPSGHAQTAIIVWGYLAAKINKAWAWIVAASIILLVAWSRIGLGMHFPTDLLGGWILGGLMVWVLIRYDDSITNFFADLYLPLNAIVAASLPVAIAYLFLEGFIISVCGALSGIWLGVLIKPGYDYPNTFTFYLIPRYFLGVMGLLLLYFGLKMVMPLEGMDYYLVLKYVRYLLVGLWVCLYSFIRVRKTA